ncbi:MAG: hypothetical protein QM632_05580 [Micrococcaceae bacterium]
MKKLNTTKNFQSVAEAVGWKEAIVNFEIQKFPHEIATASDADNRVLVSVTDLLRHKKNKEISRQKVQKKTAWMTRLLAQEIANETGEKNE